MKKIIMALALALITFSMQGQNVVYDYAWLTYFYGARELKIVSTAEEKRVIDLKAAGGKDPDMDQRQLMEEVSRLESGGWELFDTEVVEGGIGYVWIMRKPKR